MNQQDELNKNGFAAINNIYTTTEVDDLLCQISKLNTNKKTFRKSAGLFAIRQFLKEVPSATDILFNNNLTTILQDNFGGNYFVVKSIYFDKPPASNWFVSYHQDLTISVDKKMQVDGFNCWTSKKNQHAVQPPLSILQNILTVRIHLDDTDEQNGALKVVPGSHLKGIYRAETINWSNESEISCSIGKGGIMLMKPLLLHGSGRTINNKQRRVIHIEFSSLELPTELNWAERINVT